MADRFLYSDTPSPSQPPVPTTDRLRIESQPPSTPKSRLDIGIPVPSEGEEVNGSGQVTRYPFTKGVSLRNDGVGYGEVIVETFACFASGSFVVEEKQRSRRTRTSRAFPPLTNGQNAKRVPDPDLRSLAFAQDRDATTVVVPASAKVPAGILEQ
jgi:hypothetical protein